MNNKDQQNREETPAPAPLEPVTPLAANKMAENPNPRANENLDHQRDSRRDQQHEVGSEITDGEDA